MRVLRRFWRHLTRTRARWGWVLFFVSILIYVLWPADAVAAGPVRQVVLVVASVAVGAVFLPELSDDLWTIKADQVKGLIPEERVQALQASLTSAQVSEPDWASRILGSALRPLIDVDATPHRVIEDLSYMIQVHPDQIVQFDTGQRLMHRVEASIRGRRILPPAGPHGLYWVSVARDPQILDDEFTASACLYREVMELDPDWSDEQWRTAVLQFCSARLVLGGAAVEAASSLPSDTAPPQKPGLVRWYFTSPELEQSARERKRVTITIALDHAMDATCNRIFFSLAQHYASGSSQVTIRLYDKDDRFRLDPDVYFGRALGTAVDVSVVTKDSLCKQLTIVTADDTLLWPGSGATLAWSPRSPAKGEAAPERTWPGRLTDADAGSR